MVAIPSLEAKVDSKTISEEFPLVEILIATYQGEAFLAEQLDSLIEQTYRPLRILIRDDCSSDATQSIIYAYCEKYPKVFKQIPSSQRVGVCQNFSLLLAVSSAPYVMFCDQDDVWFPEKIAKTLQRMKEVQRQYGGPCLVHTDLRVVDRHLSSLASSFWEYLALDVEDNPAFSRVCLRNEVTGCAMMMNRALVEKITPLPEEVIMHDFWIALVASAFGRIGVVPEATIAYRQHGRNCLGAKKFSWFRWFRQGLRACFSGERGKNFARLVLQARAFLEIYEGQLGGEIREWLISFISLPRLSAGKRLVMAKRLGLFRRVSLHSLVRAACFLLPQAKSVQKQFLAGKIDADLLLPRSIPATKE